MAQKRGERGAPAFQSALDLMHNGPEESEKIGTTKTGTLRHLNKKDLQILKILKGNPEGLRAKTIMGLAGLPRRTGYNHLKKLSKYHLVQNIHPIWKIVPLQASSPKLAHLLEGDTIQAHKFSFGLTLIHKPQWWEKRSNRMIRLKDFQFRNVDWGNNEYQQISNKNFIIQLFSNSIIFINQRQYYGQDPYECFIQSLEDTLNIYQFIEEKFKFKFYLDGTPQFFVRTHHYVKLRDAIAKRCKKARKKFAVMIEGKLRAWIDLSEPFGLEFGEKDHAPEDTKKYSNFVGDIISHDDLPLYSDYVQRTEELMAKNAAIMQGIQENQMVFDQNMKSHVTAIRQLGDSVMQLTRLIKDMQKQQQGG